MDRLFPPPTIEEQIQERGWELREHWSEVSGEWCINVNQGGWQTSAHHPERDEALELAFKGAVGVAKRRAAGLETP